MPPTLAIVEQTPSIEFLHIYKGVFKIPIVDNWTVKIKPDCSGVELSGGDVKDGEGSGGTELAKENQDGEGDTLQGEREIVCWDIFRRKGPQCVSCSLKPSQGFQPRCSKRLVREGRRPAEFS